MNRCIIVGTILFASMLLQSAQAQDSVLNELYGQGVHAYFAGDLRFAHQMFTDAIKQGSRDPRCYYYRGLTYSSLGRPTEADADFRKGAEVEVAAPDRIYPIADSLQRVQGRTRLQIERYRQVARLTTHTKTSNAQQVRFDELKRAEGEVLRNPARAPATSAAPAAAGAPATDKSDPFSGATDVMPEKAPERPMPAATETPMPMPADPFTPGAAAPATPATPPADEAKVDPFTDDKPAAPAAPMNPAPATPAPATPPAEKPATDDPFGT